MRNHDYIKKWLNDTLRDDEKRMFEQTDEYRSLERLSKALISFKAPEYNPQSEFQRIQTAKHSRKAEKVIAMPWLQPLLRVAAVLLILTGSYFIFLWNPTTTFATLASEKTELFLPDSSAVTLNALSKLSYQAKHWGRKRAVTLDGEAFFKVAKGSQFDVETEVGTITVLGTQFNVKMRTDYFEVVCYEGLVAVKHAGNVVKLPPAKMFRVVKGIITPDESTTEVLPGWLMQESSFESVPFGEVIKEFERQYSVSVTTNNIDLNQLFTGRFVHSNFPVALKSISIPLNLKYEVAEDQKNVALSGEIK